MVLIGHVLGILRFFFAMKTKHFETQGCHFGRYTSNATIQKPNGRCHVKIKIKIHSYFWIKFVHIYNRYGQNNLDCAFGIPHMTFGGWPMDPTT